MQKCVVLQVIYSLNVSGYQVYILAYSLHYILNQNIKIIKPGDLNSCLYDLVWVCPPCSLFPLWLYWYNYNTEYISLSSLWYNMRFVSTNTTDGIEACNFKVCAWTSIYKEKKLLSSASCLVLQSMRFAHLASKLFTNNINGIEVCNCIFCAWTLAYRKIKCH